MDIITGQPQQQQQQQQQQLQQCWEQLPDYASQSGEARRGAGLLQLQGVLAYSAVMPWQAPAGSVRLAALVQASSMLLITLEDLAEGSPALAVGIGWLVWLWLQIVLTLGQNAVRGRMPGRQ